MIQKDVTKKHIPEKLKQEPASQIQIPERLQARGRSSATRLERGKSRCYLK